MRLDEYRYTLLENPIGHNVSVETWNDCMTMILYQADNGKVVMSYSQLEKLVEFANLANNNNPVLKLNTATPEGFCKCGTSIEHHTGMGCLYRPATKT